MAVGRAGGMRSVLLLAVVVCTAVGLYAWHASSVHHDTCFRGVCLGMKVAQVRRGFDAPAAGRWNRESGGDVALVWDDGPHPSLEAPVRAARFEFHDGRLVAVRADVSVRDASAGGDRIEVSRTSVAEREPLGQGRVHLTVLSRDCPTQASEVEQLLASR